MNVPTRSYKDLKVWQAAIDLTDAIYTVTAAFPKFELYSLGDQLRRAAVSVPSNIAEGQQRASTREFLHFLSISRGSVAELETQLMIAGRRNYLGEDELQELNGKLDEIRRMIYVLQLRLREKL